ncbi:MAG: hypothetical protein Q9168_008384 [Polycauliona sp. 1 TL-2023]
MPSKDKDGLDYLNTLHETIANPAAVDNLLGRMQLFQQYYDCEPAVLSDPNWGAAVRDDLAFRGIDLHKMFPWSTYAQTPGTEASASINPYTNLFYTNAGVIVRRRKQPRPRYIR